MYFLVLFKLTRQLKGTLTLFLVQVVLKIFFLVLNWNY